MYWIEKGGILMYFIAGMSILGTTVIIERFFYFVSSERRRFDDIRDEFQKYLEKNDVKGAIEFLGKSKSASGRVVKDILSLWSKTKTTNLTTLEEKARETALTEIATLEKNMWILSMVAHVTPLLGLLGTVTGMIKAFQAVAIHGTGDAAVLAEGISEALFTTAGGLFVAIPAMIIYNYYNKKIDNIISDIEKGSTEVINYFRR
ncbi:MotA/TolQ/ExbB proton channel family protein [Fusobacterium perfoetens]|uniref:MotA/TolQ/ExbB proton channel family protein n=1 Tax=Fusobacterium perfoetens TaxID=852 RepID=UPI000486127F|nr:MotA/TolQ/ExbB proton channel family protein [Fusobacterium perfoetens]MCI6152397.1 MotA/TolQ/ExbB proton channel family protein [Fusobacterium perfoetens]MDY3236996.1 MotA/TolQ/ExbB proton channel family protein [Fusobacterium perfoetens]